MLVLNLGWNGAHVTLVCSLQMAPVAVLLSEALEAHTAKVLPACRRAAVAIILRITGVPPSSYDDGEAWLKSAAMRASSLENTQIFFIKRSLRTGDAWSGHVAFPGGKHEDGDIDVLATAVRETWEEVGITLSEKNGFRCLGWLDDRPVYSGGKEQTGFVLSPIVFLQVVARTPKLQLQTSEVAAARWVPLADLLRQGALLPHGISREFTVYPLMHAIRCHFPAIDLPEQITGQTVWSAQPKSAVADISLAPMDGLDDSVTKGIAARAALRGADVLIQESSTHFRLWGMTLHVVSDFLDLAARHEGASEVLRDHFSLAWPPLRLSGAANLALSARYGWMEVTQWVRGRKRKADVHGAHLLALLLVGGIPAVGLWLACGRVIKN